MVLEAPPPGPRIFHPYTRDLRRYRELEGADADVAVARLMLGPPSNAVFGVDAIEGYTGFDSVRWGVLRELGRARSLAVRRYATSHVVFFTPWSAFTASAAEGATQGGALLQRFTDPEFEVWEVPHRPWALFAAAAVPVRGLDGARTVTSALIANGDDGTVAVETDGPLPTAGGRVLDVARDAEEVRVEAESEGPALLVVNDAFWPGWRAAIDGRPAEILAADVLVRAVRWPAGRHTLVMTYAPPEVAWGWGLSAAGGLAVVALALHGGRRARAARGDEGEP